MATCADKTVFYAKLDALKTSSNGKDNKTILFISDDFYYQAKFWLGQEEGSFESMSKNDCNHQAKTVDSAAGKNSRQKWKSWVESKENS